VEGVVDEAILTRLVIDAGATVGPVYGKNGKSQLKKTLTGYNNAARYSPWLVLMDLDQDEDCAPPLVSACLAAPAPMMRLRVAVRAIEAWILADREALAKFLSVAIPRLPHDPDAVPDPKRFLVDLARNSRRRDIRDDMVPRSGSGRAAGPAYASRLIEFAVTAWRPEVAVEHSDSLRRCRDCIADLVRSLPT
jgi:hypothetical protein